MNLVGTFVELNVAHGGKAHHLLLWLGADDLAADLSWEVYNESGGHDALCFAIGIVEEWMFVVETGEH